MSAKIITVVATFQAKPGKEAGCINYDLHISPEDDGKFLFHENWTSKAHLDAHLKNTHIQVLLPRLNELAVGMPEIKIWEKIA